LAFYSHPKLSTHKNPLAKKPELKAFKMGEGLERAKDFQSYYQVASSNVVKDADIQSVFGGLHEINLQSRFSSL